jgi:hypothetical protein
MSVVLIAGKLFFGEVTPKRRDGGSRVMLVSTVARPCLSDPARNLGRRIAVAPGPLLISSVLRMSEQITKEKIKPRVEVLCLKTRGHFIKR